MTQIPSLSDIIDVLETWAPTELAASWDNVGIQIGSPQAEIRSVLLSLDVDQACLDAMAQRSYDLVITHHPIFFKPIRRIMTTDDIGKIISAFINSQSNLYSMHTNLDAAEGGVNDVLISHYGMDPTSGTPFSDGFGKWFRGPERSLDSLVSVFGTPAVGYTKPREVSTIAFCAGSGKSLLSECVDLGIDVFITGELGYHEEVFCELNHITAICPGHKETEVLILPEIQSRLNAAFKALDIDIC